MITWIKLDIGILDDAKIKIIRSHPDGNSMVILWIGLLCLAMKSERPGIIEISYALPYTLDDLANQFNIEKKTVELGLALFRKYRMIDLLDDGAIEILNFSKHQQLEKIERNNELTRLRMIKHRAKVKESNALVTRNAVTITPTDLDKDLDLDLDKDLERGAKADKPPRSPRIFKIPSIQEVITYCRERNNTVSPQPFLNHYESNGWMVGKNKMKDWKAAVRTWETRGDNNGNGNKREGASGIITVQKEYVPEPYERPTDDQIRRNIEKVHEIVEKIAGVN